MNHQKATIVLRLATALSDLIPSMISPLQYAGFVLIRLGSSWCATTTSR